VAYSVCTDIQESGPDEEGRRAGQDEGEVWSEYTRNCQEIDSFICSFRLLQTFVQSGVYTVCRQITPFDSWEVLDHVSGVAKFFHTNCLHVFCVK